MSLQLLRDDRLGLLSEEQKHPLGCVGQINDLLLPIIGGLLNMIRIGSRFSVTLPVWAE